MALRMGLLGKKIGMTQKFNEKGEWVPLSVVQTGPCVVLDIKTPDRDGYAAIQLGFDDKRESRTAKPQLGLAAKANTAPKRFIREIRLSADELNQFQVGQTVSADQVFSPGDVIDVVGTSRGKGYQGVMKRHHFAGFRATHGTHEYFRHGGSIGCRLTPGHTHKGKRMSGQMGNKRITVQNVVVDEVLPEKNLLLLKGSVPGAPQNYITLKQAAKRNWPAFQLKVTAPPVEPASEAQDAPAEQPAE